jgi:hypothetical protein
MPFNENHISGILKSNKQPITSPFLKPVNGSVLICLVRPAMKEKIGKNWYFAV